MRAHSMKSRTASFSIRTLLLAWALSTLGAVSAQPPGHSLPPLVECAAGATVPCVEIASQVSDIVGVWKQYFGSPIPATPDGRASIRDPPVRSFVLADSVENTAAPYDVFPYGTVSFDGDLMTIVVADPPPAFPECAVGTYQVRVIRVGDLPVSLHYIPVDDA